MNFKVIKLNYLYIISLITLAFLSIGCNSQKSFAPQHVNGKVAFSSNLNKPILSSNREGAKLKDNTIIMRDGVARSALLDKENLLFADSKRLLVANGCFGLTIIPTIKQTDHIILDRKHEKGFETQGCVVSASIKDKWVAGILADNTAFVYDLQQNKMIFQDRGEAIYAISSLNANPVFLDTLVIFPTLDGRLNTVDIMQGKSVRNIIVNTEKFLNNIIYLRVIKDELVSATHKKVYALIKGESYSKDIDIRDLYFDGTYIYVLSLNGFIYKLDKTLAVLKSVKLPYANLNAIIIRDNHLYTFENSGGYLIDLDLDNFKYEVFKFNFGMSRWFNKSVTLFYTDDILYINDNVLDFSRALQKSIDKPKD